MPEVSIAIPTYNGALYLEECLASAVNQSFPDIEIVVVDDCSTDATWSIAQAFSKRDKRIRIYRNPSRQGLVRNWNRLIHYCMGTWIKFLFQDDVLDIQCIQQMLSGAGAENGGRSNRFVVCDRWFIIEAGVGDDLKDFYENRALHINEIFPGKGVISAHAFAEAVVERGVGENFVGEPSSVMIRRGLWSDYSGFNPNLVHLCDLEYWSRIGTNEGMACIGAPLNGFRVHPLSASARNHMSHTLELTYLDRLVLTHDYLFHPVYRKLRERSGVQTTLKHRLTYDMAHVFRSAPGSGQWDLFQAFLERYPILKAFLPGDCPMGRGQSADPVASALRF